jgi:hypothetical protein
VEEDGESGRMMGRHDARGRKSHRGRGCGRFTMKVGPSFYLTFIFLGVEIFHPLFLCSSICRVEHFLISLGAL